MEKSKRGKKPKYPDEGNMIPKTYLMPPSLKRRLEKYVSPDRVRIELEKLSRQYEEFETRSVA